MVEFSLANLAAWVVQVAAVVAAGVWLPTRLRLGLPRARLFAFRLLLVACVALPLAQPWQQPPPRTVVNDIRLAPADLALLRQEPGDAAGSGGSSATAQHSLSDRLADARTRVSTWPWTLVAFVGLAGGVALRLGWLALGLVSLRRLRQRSTPVEAGHDAIARAESAVGVRAAFLQSPRVPRPVTFGLRHPVVLVPPGFSTLDGPQQLAVACHELLHVRRQDWLRTFGDEFVRALLWFHPAIWWLVEQIHLSAEQVIDREVISLVGDRRSYLRALLTLAESSATPRLQPAASFLDHGHLRQRVSMIMEEASMSRVRFVASLALVLATLCAGSWVVVQAFPLTATRTILPALKPQVEFAAAASSPSTLPAGPLDPGLVTPPAVEPAASPQAQAMRPGESETGPFDIPAMQRRINAYAGELANYFVLSMLHEKGGNLREAVTALEAAVKVAPSKADPYLQLISYYNRQGDFENVAQWLLRWQTVAPGDKVPYYTAASYYWEKAYRDTSLTDSQKRTYIETGLERVNMALRLDADYPEALVYKNLLLRSLALLENDQSVQKTLLSEADKLRERAIELRKAHAEASPKVPAVATAATPKVSLAAGGASASSPYVQRADGSWVFDGSRLGSGPSYAAYAAAPPPPPPPPPPPGDKSAGVRIGGDVKPPSKVVDVRPVYPADAKDAGIQGVVIIEVTIGADGKVREAKVLRSIPQLDQAAVDAVKQWEFTPTLINGVAVPVIMTVTVSFVLG
jgi:TonB family protein